VSRIAGDIVRVVPGVRAMLEAFFQGMLPEGLPDDDDDDYVPPLGDRRQKALASIKLRRGQRKFRNSLIRRYGPACAISGCTVIEIIEAAHIWPYRGDEDNHPQNGLLLRADLHTLYDLDLIGIDPSLQVHIAGALKGSEYHTLDGARLKTVAKPSTKAIAIRWGMFETGKAD
jgi:predicted restriction endonuclease